MIILKIPGRGVREFDHGVRIGRDKEWAEVPLDESPVSRHHAELRPYRDTYAVYDLSSRNGTKVNGKSVGPPGIQLSRGDVVRVAGVIDILVVNIESVIHEDPSTVMRQDRILLGLEAQVDVFVVEYRHGGTKVRGTMPFQLGLALSVLALYARERWGQVPDTDLRAIVWRGNTEGQARGDINRLLGRVREWFRSRDIESPPIIRPRRASATELDIPGTALTILPEGWLHKYIKGP